MVGFVGWVGATAAVCPLHTHIHTHIYTHMYTYECA